MLGFQEIKDILDKERGLPEHKDSDALVVAILSHGDRGCVYGTDMGRVEIDQITEYFDGFNCPTLIGKPKLFIFQACQGGEFNTYTGFPLNWANVKTQEICDNIRR